MDQIVPIVEAFDHEEQSNISVIRDISEHEQPLEGK